MTCCCRDCGKCMQSIAPCHDVLLVDSPKAISQCSMPGLEAKGPGPSRPASHGHRPHAEGRVYVPAHFHPSLLLRGLLLSACDFCTHGMELLVDPQAAWVGLCMAMPCTFLEFESCLSTVHKLLVSVGQKYCQDRPCSNREASSKAMRTCSHHDWKTHGPCRKSDLLVQNVLPRS